MNAEHISISGQEKLFSSQSLGEDLVYFTPPHAPSLVTTLSPNGTINVGAFEQTMLCSDLPPMMLLAITQGSDTYQNVRDTGECVIGFAYPAYMQQVYDAGVHLPRGESEIAYLEGITTASSSEVKPPRINQCWLSLESRLLWDKQTGDHMLCCFEIVQAVFDQRLWSDHSVLRRGGLPALYYITHGNFFIPGEKFSLEHSKKIQAVDRETR